MLYCPKCKSLCEDSAVRCPECGKRKLREPTQLDINKLTPGSGSFQR